MHNTKNPDTEEAKWNLVIITHCIVIHHYYSNVLSEIK